MSGKPRQFGIDLEQIPRVTETLKECTRLKLTGFHNYMGTRYLEPEPVIENTEKILKMAEDLADTMDVDLEVVDVGGGFGVAYFEDEAPLDTSAAARGINAAVTSFKERHPSCRVIIELGRYLSAGCGCLMTGVRYTKDSRGTRFAVADGGTNVHMAAIGTGGFAKRSFPVTNLSRPVSESHEPVSLAGPLCTPSDTLARKAHLGDVQPGDVVAVLCSGAYGPSASPTGFLSHGHPAEALLDGDALELIRVAEDVDDILADYRLPGDEPISPGEKVFDLAIRLSAADAHYGGGVVDGARVMQLFGDAVTGIAAEEDGDESLLQGWDDVEFRMPTHPGDFLKIRARLTKKSRLKRHVSVEALRTVRSLGADTSSVERVRPPEVVARATGTIVIPMPNRKKPGKERTS